VTEASAVRPGGVEACTGAAELLAATLPEAWGAASLASLLATGRGSLWLAERAGVLRGVLVGERGPDEYHVHVLAVAGDTRRRGFGAALLAAALAEARAAGLARVHLELRASNLGALALYRRFGFAALGRRPRYYTGGEDALLLSLDLAAGGATAPCGPEARA
jgi:ribosomal-protein-alanine N-acetyltransferase